VSDSVLYYVRFRASVARHSLEYLYFARLNSIHRFNLRQVEKNRFPHKTECKVCGRNFLCQSIDDYLQRQNICWGCDAGNLIKKTAETLFHLVGAIPHQERDQLGIYPADFRYPRVSLWHSEKLVWQGPFYRGPKIEYWRRRWPSRECKALFDKCQGHKDADHPVQLDPKKEEVADYWLDKRSLIPITARREACQPYKHDGRL